MRNVEWAVAGGPKPLASYIHHGGPPGHPSRGGADLIPGACSARGAAESPSHAALRGRTTNEMHDNIGQCDEPTLVCQTLIL